jgi:hypothetical protein
MSKMDGKRIERIAGLLCSLAVAGIAPAHGAGYANLFDRPAASQVLPAEGERPEVTCIWFADLMVRELATDGPGGGPSTLVPIPPGTSRPACASGNYPGGLPVENANALFIGRKGNYLMFAIYSAADAERFEVVDAHSNRVIYKDSFAPTDTGLKYFAVEGGSLHLRFTREVVAPCSIALDSANCWAKLLHEKSIPTALATPPPASICAELYRQAQDPPDDPSLVLYDVDMTLDPAGKTHIISRGAVTCGPAS